MDTWLKMFSPIMDVRLPASGDVSMDYKPWTNWGRVNPKAGNPETEVEIFRDVALPGKQLGKLIDAVGVLIEIAESSPTDNSLAESNKKKRVFKDLKKLAKEIRDKKKQLELPAKEEARKSLERLARTDKDYRSSIESMCSEIDKKKEKSQGKP